MTPSNVSGPTSTHPTPPGAARGAGRLTPPGANRRGRTPLTRRGENVACALILLATFVGFFVACYFGTR